MVAHINLRNVTLPHRDCWDPVSSLVSAIDSRGGIVPKSEIRVFGSVNVAAPGRYSVTYYFEDPHTKEKVEAIAEVIVSDKVEKKN